MPDDEAPCLTRQVLEQVAGAMGLDKLGHARLTVEYDAGNVRRWGPGSDPRNGTLALVEFDADLRARLERLLFASP